MLRLKGTLGTLLVVAIPVLIAPPAASAQIAKVGIVTTLLGTATVTRAAVAQPAPLKFKDDIYARDRITTGDDAVVRVLLGGKAIVTVRERSSLTITEAPGAATIEMGVGKIAVAAVKERFKNGETLEIKTPNAVAAIRGTVIITEVDSITAQAGGPPPGAFRTVTTVLAGQVAYTAGGTSLNLGALDQVRRTGLAAPVSQSITRDDAGRMANNYHVPTPPPPPPAAAVLGGAQTAANDAAQRALQRPVQQPAIATAIRTAVQEIRKTQDNKTSDDRPKAKDLKPSLDEAGGAAGGVIGNLKEIQRTQQSLNALSAAELAEVKATLSSNGGDGEGKGSTKLTTGKTVNLGRLNLSGGRVRVRGR